MLTNVKWKIFADTMGLVSITMVPMCATVQRDGKGTTVMMVRCMYIMELKSMIQNQFSCIIITFKTSISDQKQNGTCITIMDHMIITAQNNGINTL